jgi:hypothetical protein
MSHEEFGTPKKNWEQKKNGSRKKYWGTKNNFLAMFLGGAYKKLWGRSKNKSKDKIANREREAWEGGIALPLLGTDTLLTKRLSGSGAFLFCLKLNVPCLEAKHTSYEYAHNKEGDQKVNIHFSEIVGKSNPRGEAELNCERKKNLGCRIRGKDVALANPKCDPRTHGPKISLFPGTLPFLG